MNKVRKVIEQKDTKKERRKELKGVLQQHWTLKQGSSNIIETKIF